MAKLDQKIHRNSKSKFDDDEDEDEDDYQNLNQQERKKKHRVTRQRSDSPESPEYRNLAG